MPALDILRALIHPGKSQGKKLRKKSTLRSRKPDSVTSSSVDAGHSHRDLPLSPRSRLYGKEKESILADSVHRKPSLQKRPVYTDPPHAPSLYGPGPYPPPHAPALIYPQENQYYEYNDYASPLSPNMTSVQCPSTHHNTTLDNSWQQPSYELPGQSFPENQPNFIIEPSEPEEWSPIPDVHRQSSGSQDEFQSMHGTFGLGDRSSRRNVDSIVSDGRWTNQAEYEQSAVYEIYEEDPDTSRPVSSYYPNNPHQHLPNPPVSGSPSHIDPSVYHNVAPMRPPRHKDVPTLAIPQPSHVILQLLPQHPVHQREVSPSRHDSTRRSSKAFDPRERARSPPRPAPEVYDTPQVGSSKPSRQNSTGQSRRTDPSSASEKHEGPEQPPQEILPQRQELKGPSKISPDNIQPEIYDRDYGSDEEVYQYIVPAGVDVIFRDPSGNEITRVGEFPEPPPSGSKQPRSALMVVLDEHGKELYRNFGQSVKRRGLRYDGHVLHDESQYPDHRPTVQTPRPAGSNSSKTSTKTFLIDEQGHQIPIASSNGSRSSSSRPTRQPSKFGLGSHR